MLRISTRRAPFGSGRVGWTNRPTTWKMTMPTEIAKAMARPPTIVRPGYFTSMRAPSLRSSHTIELLLPMLLRPAADFVPPDESWHQLRLTVTKWRASNGGGLRQQDRECGPSGLARHPDRAAVTLDDRFGDGQAQATAGAFRRACRVDFVK